MQEPYTLKVGDWCYVVHRFNDNSVFTGMPASGRVGPRPIPRMNTRRVIGRFIITKVKERK